MQWHPSIGSFRSTIFSPIFGGRDEIGLIDEYQFLMHPLVMGSGKPLFQGIAEQINLKLLRTESLKNGIIVLYCEPVGRTGQ